MFRDRRRLLVGDRFGGFGRWIFLLLDRGNGFNLGFRTGCDGWAVEMEQMAAEVADRVNYTHSLFFLL